jgi:hypothetical protein
MASPQMTADDDDGAALLTPEETSRLLLFLKKIQTDLDLQETQVQSQTKLIGTRQLLLKKCIQKVCALSRGNVGDIGATTTSRMSMSSSSNASSLMSMSGGDVILESRHSMMKPSLRLADTDEDEEEEEDDDGAVSMEKRKFPEEKAHASFSVYVHDTHVDHEDQKNRLHDDHVHSSLLDTITTTMPSANTLSPSPCSQVPRVDYHHPLPPLDKLPLPLQQHIKRLARDSIRNIQQRPQTHAFSPSASAITLSRSIKALRALLRKLQATARENAMLIAALTPTAAPVKKSKEDGDKVKHHVHLRPPVLASSRRCHVGWAAAQREPVTSTARNVCDDNDIDRVRHARALYQCIQEIHVQSQARLADLEQKHMRLWRAYADACTHDHRTHRGDLEAFHREKAPQEFKEASYRSGHSFCPSSASSSSSSSSLSCSSIEDTSNKGTPVTTTNIDNSKNNNKNTCDPDSNIIMKLDRSAFLSDPVNGAVHKRMKSIFHDDDAETWSAKRYTRPRRPHRRQQRRKLRSTRSSLAYFPSARISVEADLIDVILEVS